MLSCFAKTVPQVAQWKNGKTAPQGATRKARVGEESVSSFVRGQSIPVGCRPTRTLRCGFARYRKRWRKMSGIALSSFFYRLYAGENRYSDLCRVRKTTINPVWRGIVMFPTFQLGFCLPKRILIADDHESVLRRVRAMLDSPAHLGSVWGSCEWARSSCESGPTQA